MKFRQLIYSLIAVLAGVASARAQSEYVPGTYFQYPLVPDSISTLQGRCNYLADHFFDFCDLKKAFSVRQKIGAEFEVYLSILGQASPERGVAAAANLMRKLEKQPDDQLFIAKIAEANLYGDTAEVWNDRLYIPFAEAIASNRRIERASKARFAHQAKVLANSLVGGKAPDLPYVTPSGEARNVRQDSAEVVIVMITDPGCSDCSMARLRLDADISLTELINEGKVKMVAVAIIDPTDPEWPSVAAEFPATWTVGANPEADMLVDMRMPPPGFYIIDRRGNIRFKHLDANQVIDVARQLKKR